MHASTSGFSRRQPNRDSLVGQTALAFLQHLQGGIFDVRHTAHVEREHARPVLRDERANLIADLLRIGEKQPALRPQDQKPFKRFVIGILGRQRAQHVGAALAANDVNL